MQYPSLFVTFFRKVGVIATVLSSAFAGVAYGDATLSSSTDPTGSLSNRLTALLGQEHRALGAITPERLLELTTAPRKSLRPMPRAEMPVVVNYDSKWLAEQPTATGGAQWECLTEALYFEARGESIRGQFAVAEVIMNRVSSRSFPNSVCSVVNQGTGKRHQCQFSYTCDGNPEIVNEPAAHRRVAKIASALLDGAPRMLTDGATYYHTKAVNPRWARKFTKTATIGVHYFYRNPTQVSRR